MNLIGTSAVRRQGAVNPEPGQNAVRRTRRPDWPAICATVALAYLPATVSAAQAQGEVVVPVFEEQAVAAGIDHRYSGGFEFFVGGGAASFDCNNDRFADIVVAGGEASAVLYVNQSVAGRDIRFAQKPLLNGSAKNVLGTYPVNLDNDAFTDLVLVRLGQNYLLKGGPDCTFSRANDAYGFDGRKAWTTGFSAIWERGANYPTLAFGNYIDQEAPDAPWGTCADNRIVRPRPDAAVFSKSIALTPSYCSLSVLMTDWNNTGQFDLRITNDRQYYRGGQEQLWSLNDGGEPVQYGQSDGWRELVIRGMGIAQADLDGDGRPEYALSSMGDTVAIP